MLCEKCHTRPAVVSYHQIINGQEEWLYLCDSCARNYEFANLFEKRMADFSDFVHDLFGAQLEGGEAEPTFKKRCPLCGRSYDAISKSGKVGCAQCYRTFSEELKPVIEKLHGKTACYQGEKMPPATPEEPPSAQAEELSALEAELQSAVDRRAFEEASELLNRIQRIQAGGEAK